MQKAQRRKGKELVEINFIDVLCDCCESQDHRAARSPERCSMVDLKERVDQTNAVNFVANQGGPTQSLYYNHQSTHESHSYSETPSVANTDEGGLVCHTHRLSNTGLCRADQGVYWPLMSNTETDIGRS